MKQFKVIGKNGKEIHPTVPTHPGEVLADELESRDIQKKDFAAQLKLPPSNVSELISGKRHVSAMLAIKFEKLLGIDAAFWLRMQNDFDLAVAKKKIYIRYQGKASRPKSKSLHKVVKNNKLQLLVK